MNTIDPSSPTLSALEIRRHKGPRKRVVTRTTPAPRRFWTEQVRSHGVPASHCAASVTPYQRGFQPDLVKLDMALLRGIDHDAMRVIIVRNVVRICRELGCEVLAEGVETIAEYSTLRDMGIALFQGYLFARPQLEALPRPDAALWDVLDADLATR